MTDAPDEPQPAAKPAADEVRRIEALARDRLGLSGASVLGLLGGGVSGQSFLVAAGKMRYVVKRIDTDARLIDLETEFTVLERLATAGIAPKPVAFDLAEGLLASEYIVGARALTPAELGAPGNVERLADLLKRLHGSALALPAFAPEVCAADYLARLGGIESLAPAECARAEALLALAADFRARFAAPAVPCHNDLVAANVIHGDIGLRLVDFEYAAAAGAALDLASVVVMNALDPAGEARLLRAYYAPERPPFSRREFAKVRRLVALLAHFWAGVRVAAGDDRVDRYLERDN